MQVCLLPHVQYPVGMTCEVETNLLHCSILVTAATSNSGTSLDLSTKDNYKHTVSIPCMYVVHATHNSPSAGIVSRYCRITSSLTRASAKS